MSGTFGKFLMFFVCDQRTMNVYRNLPSECFVDTVVFRCRRKILISSDNVSDSHQMVIYNVCKVVGRVSVRLDQNQVFHFFVVYCDVSVNYIVESSGSLCRHIETDNMRFACIQTSLYFFFGKVQTSLVIDGDLLACNDTFHGFQFLRTAEAVVSITLFNKLLCIFEIDSGCLSLTLYVRTYAAVLVRTFIVKKSCTCHGTIDDIYSSFYITLLVCILDSKDKVSIFMFCNQVCVQCGTQISYMHPACRARCKSGSDLCHFIISCLSKM